MEGSNVAATEQADRDAKRHAAEFVKQLEEYHGKPMESVQYTTRYFGKLQEEIDKAIADSTVLP